jgi:Ca-activated chloride channel family protein
VFILDRSGSMAVPDQGGGTKIATAREELIRAITALKDGSTFNIIFYSSGFEEWQKKMTVVDAASRKKAIDWVKSIEAVGSTNIFDPLERAFELAGRGTHDKAYGLLLDTIYFMSDGLANRGRIIAANDILKEVSRMNTLKKVKIHAIGIGPDHDVGLMRGIADLSGGTYIAK